MAFTDFELTGTQATVLHSAAPLTTNPLTSSVAGVYCRSMTIATNSAAAKIYFTTSSYGGAFYNIPSTKVVSGRACFRTQNPNNNSYITIKDTTSFIGGPAVVPGGYKFGISAYGIYLMGNDNATLQYTSTSRDFNKWYSLRMDVFPLGVIGDRIICYMEVASSGSSTSSPGSGIWNSTILGTSFDITVAVADARYAPWGNNNRNGVHTSYSGNAPETHYVDNINFTTYNAP